MDIVSNWLDKNEWKIEIKLEIESFSFIKCSQIEVSNAWLFKTAKNKTISNEWKHSQVLNAIFSWEFSGNFHNFI